MEPLTELANFYGSDKGTSGPRPNSRGHNYTSVYESYLKQHRTSAITILEIGLGVIGEKWESLIVTGRNTGGASLKMWYDYFPNASIYGIDINSCAYLDNDRIKTFVVDQGNLQELTVFSEAINVKEFDVIIDDGSHRPDHQQISLGFFFKKLKRQGLYIIEDLMSNGLNDGMTGRHAFDQVLNTRQLLKHFKQSGGFQEPNALIDIPYLEQNIATVDFYFSQKNTAEASHEAMCVIRKS
jgi:hypothetical protein